MLRKVASLTLLPLLGALLLGWIKWGQLDRISFDGDENAWIANSHGLSALVKGIADPYWNSKENLNYAEGTVPGYVVGLWLKASGIEINKVSRARGWRPEQIVPQDLLILARKGMCVLYVCSAFLLLLIAQILGGSIATLILCCSLYFDKDMPRYLLTVNDEGSLLFFTLIFLICLASSLHLKIQARSPPTSRTSRIYIIATFVFCSAWVGIMSAAKFNACTAVFVLPLAVLIRSLMAGAGKIKSCKIAVLCFILSASVSCFTFNLLTPLARKSPQAFFLRAVKIRTEILKDQARMWPEATVRSAKHRVNFLFTSISGLGYNKAWLRWIRLLLGLTGLSYCIKNIHGKSFKSALSLIILVSALFLCIPPLFTPLAWYIYLMYPFVYWHIFVAIGATFLARLMLNYVRGAIFWPCPYRTKVL